MAYGPEEAIMLTNIEFWIKKNEANGKHFHDGRYWTYNSLEAFTQIFPFWSVKQIRRILKSLIDQGAIVTGSYNQSVYDHTTWYALSDSYAKKGKHGVPEDESRISQMSSQIRPNGKIITDSVYNNIKPITQIKNTDKKPDIFTAQTRAKNEDFYQGLLDLGVKPETAKDWLAVRKAKRAVNTAVALAGIRREVEKMCSSDKTICADDCVRMAVEQNWQGFRADWMIRVLEGYKPKQQPRFSSKMERAKKDFDDMIQVGKELGCFEDDFKVIND